ncbi:MAG TPA: hypothetical protein VNH46_06240, partial [Gemmatimonadales bacterium]|nr:hypothetical protein [Gemmatimonadales bacterium]
VAREAALLNRRLEAGGEGQGPEGPLMVEAARVAGLTPERYRSVGVAVDSLLRARPGRGSAPADATMFASAEAAQAFGHMARELDSFRVELIVLRVRLSGLGHPRD